MAATAKQINLDIQSDSMNDDACRTINSPFFMKSVSFTDGILEFVFGSQSSKDGKIVFDHVRSFLFFKEGDFYTDLSRYEVAALFVGSEPSVGVFRVERHPILESVLKGRLDVERPSFFWVSTPDECLEIISFSDPRLLSMSA